MSSSRGMKNLQREALMTAQRTLRRLIGAVACMGASIAGAFGAPAKPAAKPAAAPARPAAVVTPRLDSASIEFFERKIRPVLIENCYQCHSAKSEKLKAGLYCDS